MADLLVYDSGTQHLGYYQLLECIGQGSTCKVYRGFDERIRRNVAIKVVPRHLLATPLQIAQFRNEVEIQGQLIHPNIAKLYNTHEGDGFFAMVMELLNGCTLEEFLQHQQTMSPGEIHSLSRAVLSALEKAHAQHIVHRDLKSSNIFLCNDGGIKLKDFGLAAYRGHSNGTHSTSSATHQYISPEQILGKQADERSDLYAFGILLYRMSVGIHPFASQGTSDFELMEKHVREIPQAPSRIDPSIPTALSDALMQLLQKSPDDRPQTCQQVYQMLRHIGKEVPINARGSAFSDFHRNPAFSKMPAPSGDLYEKGPDSIKKRATNTLSWAIQSAAEAYENKGVASNKIKPEIINRLNKVIFSIPPLPDMWHLVQNVLDSPEASPADLAAVVRSDPVLTAHILSLVNSAAFAVPGREISNISMAIARIGMDNIHNFLIQKLAPDFTRLTPLHQRGSIPVWEEMNHIWLHSQAVGKLAASLAGMSPHISNATVRMLGMMHDIGKLVILHIESDETLETLKLDILEDKPALQAEQESLGYTHIDAGMMLALHWKLPRSLQQFIYCHHHPENKHSGPWPDDLRFYLLLVHTAHVLIQSIHAVNGIPDSIWGPATRTHPAETEKMLRNSCRLSLDDEDFYHRLCDEYAWIEGNFFQSMAGKAF